MPRPLVRSVAVAAVLVGLSAPTPADDDDPFAPDPNKKTATGPKATWSGGLQLPAGHNTPLTVGPPGCPVALSGTTVWDLKANTSAATLEGVTKLEGMRALSHDGKYFAAASKSPNQYDTAVGVWDTATGKGLQTIPGAANENVDVMLFSRSRYLIVGGRHDRSLHVWDVTTGKKVKTLTVPHRRVEAGQLAFTPDGKFFACIAHDKIVVQDTATGKQAGVFVPTSGTGPAGGRPRPTGLDAIFVLSRAAGLRFSPDGQELAVFTAHPFPRILCWSSTGKLVFDEPVAVPGSVAPADPSLEWVPDKTGWFVNGRLVDRAAKRVVLAIKVPFAAQTLPHLLDKDRLLTPLGDRDHVEAVTIPWSKIAASVKAMGGKDGAYLSPAEPVSVEVTVAAARGNADETRQLIAGAVAQRLNRDGLRVADGRPTVVRVNLTEQAGDTLRIVERQNPFDFRGQDTGRRATEAKGAVTLEIIARGQDAPLWRGQLSAGSARSFREEINDASIRKSMLESLTRQLNDVEFPYFVPKDRTLIELPAVLE